MSSSVFLSSWAAALAARSKTTDIAEFEAEDQAKYKKENAALWYLFVHINGDDVRAELSFPKHIEDGQFKGFNERIYIIKPGEWASMMPKVDDNEPPAQDFEINVTRKS